MPNNHADFLVEIHTEELPPKALGNLASSFLTEIKKGLTQAQLEFSDAEFFATPRRLAVKVTNLSDKQPDNLIERRGPAWQAAFDANGQPTAACVGFARSCDITPDQLITIENNQGKWVGAKQTILGKEVNELLPTLVNTALANLPIPKAMRWGSSDVTFVRPVHSVILLYGAEVIDATILGCRTDRKTQGHRFQCKHTLSIPTPNQYEDILEKKGFVLADFSERKNKIFNEASSLVQRTLGKNAQIVIDEKLLDEVTGLVEWPVPLLGKFDEVFLKVPQEALISAMQAHQRYFPVMDMRDKLLPYFVTISNIESRDVEQVIAGNQRVLRARLSDAAFFYETDKKIKLIDRLEKLAGIIFQAKLGSLLDKTKRVVKLATYIAELLKLNAKHVERAALLAKTDLTTELVGEFPELQGIAGFYYAMHDGEIEAVADAIKESYYPRFSGDGLPDSLLSCAVALADRLDTLVGIFGINLAPTGDKDPFGLRRSTIGVLRILIEKKLNLDVRDLLKKAYSFYDVTLPNQNVVSDIWNFLLERLKPWYQDQAVSVDVFLAVAALDITNLYDMHNRILAVREFKNLPQAQALSIANKRVGNILTQYAKAIQLTEIDNNLFEHAAEHELVKQLNQQAQEVAALIKKANYQAVLTRLANLREPVDQFFDNVLVMAEDEKRKENRLLILKKLRELFLQVADVALLQC